MPNRDHNAAALLGLMLPGWKVEDVRLGEPVIVTVRPVSDERQLCPRREVHGPGGDGSIVRYGSTRSSAIEVPTGGVCIALEVVRARFLCTACRATFLEDAPLLAPGARLTQRCADYVEEQLDLVPVGVVADELGIAASTLHAIAAGMREPALASQFDWGTLEDLTICTLCLRRYPRGDARQARTHLFALRRPRAVNALICPVCADEGHALWIRPRASAKE